VDRLVVRPDDRARLTDSIETALKLADGAVEIANMSKGSSHPERSEGSAFAAGEMFSERYGCPTCGISLPELEPRHFSFNSPFGACPKCGGLGTRRQVSEELILGGPRISILEGVILPWGEPSGYLRKIVLPALARQLKFDLSAAWGELPKAVRDCIVHGEKAKPGAKGGDAPCEGGLTN